MLRRQFRIGCIRTTSVRLQAGRSGRLADAAAFRMVGFGLPDQRPCNSRCRSSTTRSGWFPTPWLRLLELPELRAWFQLDESRGEFAFLPKWAGQRDSSFWRLRPERERQARLWQLRAGRRVSARLGVWSRVDPNDHECSSQLDGAKRRRWLARFRGLDSVCDGLDSGSRGRARTRFAGQCRHPSSSIGPIAAG